ncbi:MAG: ABC transporter ATP-binding protein [Patescibacteria group bacterium]
MNPALSIEQLRKTYNGKVVALNGVDLEVKQGDFFALLGPNGAGKTTLIGVITGLVNKDEGRVRIFGKDIDDDAPLAKIHVGVVPQEFNFSLFTKIIDTVVWQAGYFGIPKRVAMERAEYFFKQLGLWDQRNDAARTLSGGMKRRLMIARALIHEPKLLILDEPTAGVDIELRHDMWKFLEALNKSGVTIILTTHYLEEAEQLCRNVAIIDRGNIVASGSIKELLARRGPEVLLFDMAEGVGARELTALAQFQPILIDERTIELTLGEEHNLNVAVLALSQLGVTVKGLRNRHNRLEELFLSLTHKRT